MWQMSLQYRYMHRHHHRLGFETIPIASIYSIRFVGVMTIIPTSVLTVSNCIRLKLQ